MSVASPHSELLAWLELGESPAASDPVRVQTAKTLMRAVRAKESSVALEALLATESLDISRDPWLGGGAGVNFGFLAHMPRLKNLKADHQRVDSAGDAAPLWQRPWTSLSLQNLKGCEVPTAVLADHAAESLVSLSLGGCIFDSADRAALGRLTRLRSLALPKTALNDASFVAGMSELESLDLSENNLSRLPTLSGCPGLKVLLVKRNAISDLAPLANLKLLRTLDVSENSVSDLGPLTGARNLETLRFSRNSVRSVRPLRDLDRLETVSVAMNPVAEDEIEDMLRRRVRLE